MEVQDLPPVVSDDEKAVQNTKRERWDGEEIHRSNGLAMVSEERQPPPDGMRISRGSSDPARNAPFRYTETYLARTVRRECVALPRSDSRQPYEG
jgi:hypothetical protein